MPDPGENIQTWSTTALDNGNADSLIYWPEGQSRTSVNDSARSMMAAHAKDRNLTNGSIVTSGAINALTFVSGLGYTIAPVPTGLITKLRIGPGLTNTGPCTLSMDGITAAAILDNNGQPLIGRELNENSYQDFRWDGTNWILLRDTSQGVILLDTKTASASATLDFLANIDATYKTYVFEGINLRAAVDNAAFWIRYSQDGGVSYKSGAADYQWTSGVSDANAGQNGQGSMADSQIVGCSVGISSTSGYSLSFTVRLYNPASVAQVKLLRFDGENTNATGGVLRWSGAGALVSNVNAVDGIRFMLSNGDITSGEIKMYGLK